MTGFSSLSRNPLSETVCYNANLDLYAASRLLAKGD